MLLIISLLVAILILIISIYFLYGRVMSGKDRILEVPNPNKNTQVDANIPQKKSKKQKKAHKTVNSESGGMKTPGEIVILANEPPIDNIQIEESIIEPTINVSQETGNTDVENSSSNNEIIEALKSKIDEYETEIKMLNSMLEEANEKIASCKEEAEDLSEKIKNIQTKLILAENSKSKIEEQLKKAENSNSESLVKTVELERRLAQNNAENVDLKLKVDSFSQRLDKSEAQLKSEQEKLKLEQEKLKLLKKENDKLVKKNEEIQVKSESDNLNHIKMYQEYEKKIERLKTEQKAVKHETVKLNSLLQEKEQSITQLNEQINQLNIELIASKEKNDTISSNFEKISRDMTDQATEWNNENRRLSDNLVSLKSEISGKEGIFESKIQQLTDELKERELNLHNLEGENWNLKEEVNKLRIELREKIEEITKNESLSDLLKSNSDEIESLKHSNRDLLAQIEIAERNLSQKTEEFQLKLQESLVKVDRFHEIDNENKEFKIEIERLRSENSANFENFQEKSNLIEEITHLKSASTNKDEELNISLNKALEELKEKSNDLRVLQDQKIDQLQQIEQLKKEISSREFSVNEKIIELSKDIKEKEIVIEALVNEKKNLEIKLKNVGKSFANKEIELENSKFTVEFEEATKQLEIRNTEMIKLENEKVQLMRDIDQMKYEKEENDCYIKRQINDLQENLEKKTHELTIQNEAYLSIKDKYDALEQKLFDSVVSNSLQTQFLGNNFSVEDDIQEIRLKPDFQVNQTSVFTNDDSLTIEEMQSHINKLESELLVLQRKYYELKNTNIGSSDAHDSDQKFQQNINICPTDIVSIPPIISTIPIDTPTEKSQSHSLLLESIEKLNIEISEQRLKNQTLDKQFFDKNNEVNALKQCLFGLDGDLFSIEHLALNLQNSFSDSYSEKNKLKSEYNQLLKDHEDVKAKYDKLVTEFKVLKNSSEINDNSETITVLEEQLKKCQDDNCQLKLQLDHYRETLEKTENCLQNIQASVDQEENNWKICLKSSEQEQERLEEKIRELLNQIDDLRNQKHSDSSAMISMETPSIANGSLSSETKKKRKRKNKKKKNKNRVTQP